MAVAGRLVAVAALMAAAAVTLLAGGAAADCFDYCYKNCIANDKSMADYCNYACGKTCESGLLQKQRPPLAAAAVGGGLPHIRCQIDCVRRSCYGFRQGQDRKGIVACYRGCFDGCKTKTVPKPRPDQPFHEKDAVVQPARAPDHPFYEKQDVVQAVAVPDHRFHEKDGVRPSSVPDHP